MNKFKFTKLTVFWIFLILSLFTNQSVVLAQTPTAINKLPAYCYPEYQRLTLNTFNDCVFVGMSYVQVANVVGNRGTLQVKSSRVEIWRWNGNNPSTFSTDGVMTVTFVKGKVSSKAQFGLTSDLNY